VTKKKKKIRGKTYAADDYVGQPNRNYFIKRRRRRRRRTVAQL